MLPVNDIFPFHHLNNDDFTSNLIELQSNNLVEIRDPTFGNTITIDSLNQMTFKICIELHKDYLNEINPDNYFRQNYE